MMVSCLLNLLKEDSVILESKKDNLRAETFIQWFGSILNESFRILNNPPCVAAALFDAKGELIIDNSTQMVNIDQNTLLAALKKGSLVSGDVLVVSSGMDFNEGEGLSFISGIFYEGQMIWLLAITLGRENQTTVIHGMPRSQSLHIKILEKFKSNDEAFLLCRKAVESLRQSPYPLNTLLDALSAGTHQAQTLIESLGVQKMQKAAKTIQGLSQDVLKATLAAHQPGVFLFEDCLEVPHADHLFETDLMKIGLRLTVDKEKTVFDFTATDPHLALTLPLRPGFWEWVILLCLRSLAPRPFWVGGTTSGLPFKVILPAFQNAKSAFTPTLLSGTPEIIVRLMDIVNGALSKSLNDRIGAAGFGTLNAVGFHGEHAHNLKPFFVEERLGGGAGASPNSPGAFEKSLCIMGGPSAQSIEALEKTCPIHVLHFGIRPLSGGKGKMVGGNGCIKTYSFLAPMRVGVLSQRRLYPPFGLRGGMDGETGANTLIQNSEKESTLPPTFALEVKAKEVLRIETPGGGGYGPKP